MPLLSSQDEQVLTTHLAAIDTPVSLLLFTQTIGGSESGLVARQVLDEIARLNDKITVVEKNFVLDVDERTQYGLEVAPALVILRDGEDTRMRFYGAPTGYEFVGLVEGILLAGTGRTDLDPATLAKLDALDAPLHLRVFSTPTCPHCPKAVVLAFKMAFASPQVTASAIEATEFMEMSRQYRVTGVPKTVVNDTVEILGALPEAEFVDAALGGPGPDTLA